MGNQLQHRKASNKKGKLKGETESKEVKGKNGEKRRGNRPKLEKASYQI